VFVTYTEEGGLDNLITTYKNILFFGILRNIDTPFFTDNLKTCGVFQINIVLALHNREMNFYLYSRDFYLYSPFEKTTYSIVFTFCTSPTGLELWITVNAALWH
jgi:hypothetical protein